MKYICILIILLANSLFAFGQLHEANFVPDTIDFNNQRFKFLVPEESVAKSIKACDGHGCIYYFPLSDKNEGITFANLVMTEFDFEDSMEYDSELWNCFDEHNNGSRGYVVNDHYYRIDKYEDGTIVFYSNLSYQAAQIANRVMNSVIVRRKIATDNELSTKKREKGKIISS